jgi:hypothetical protein
MADLYSKSATGLLAKRFFREGRVDRSIAVLVPSAGMCIMRRAARHRGPIVEADIPKNTLLRNRTYFQQEPLRCRPGKSRAALLCNFSHSFLSEKRPERPIERPSPKYQTGSDRWPKPPAARPLAQSSSPMAEQAAFATIPVSA